MIHGGVGHGLGPNFAVSLKMPRLKLRDLHRAEERPDIRFDALLDDIGRRLLLSFEMREVRCQELAARTLSTSVVVTLPALMSLMN